MGDWVLLPIVKLAVSLSVTPASPWPQHLMIVDTGCLFVIFMCLYNGYNMT